jgi:hypothetical protein
MRGGVWKEHRGAAELPRVKADGVLNLAAATLNRSQQLKQDCVKEQHTRQKVSKKMRPARPRIPPATPPITGAARALLLRVTGGAELTAPAPRKVAEEVWVMNLVT